MHSLASAQVHLWCERVAEGAAKGGPSGETIAGKAVAIHVDDDGQGMHDEVRARIFEPFFTTKNVGAGTGLGLSVSHGIIQEHGGFISVQSSPGSGSQFCVYLPATAE